MLADADVCVISQRAGGGVAFHPSKLLSCAAMGKPVLAVAEEGSELARVVKREELGQCTTPQVNTVAEAMRGLAAKNLTPWGENGQRFAARYDERKVLAEFEEILNQLAQ